MGLAKTGYSDAIRGTTRVNVAVDENGQIAPQGGEIAGTKAFQINKANAENSLSDNTEVLNFFITLAQGVSDSMSNTMTVKWGV